MATACAICGSDRIEPLIARRDTPVFQNAVYADAATATAAPRGDLDYRRCQACGFVWNAAFSSDRLAYSPAYENRQSLSPAFDVHLKRRAAAARALIDGRGGAAIVDVGCGQGDFLDYLAKAAPAEPAASLFGFDPAWRGEDGQGPAGARVYRRLFAETEALNGAPADLIVSRHVIEHIPEPMEFLAILRRCAGPETRLAIETPDIDWIRRTGAFHDFFYEHCSLFSLPALDKALARSGFLATRLERVFDQQYLWAEARAAPAEAAAPATAYQARWETIIARATAAGPVVVWGAGAKGATFVQMFDPDASRIAAVVDLNPAKQDRHLGGTGHKVVSPEAAAAIAPATILVMNPAYEAEIGDYVRGHGWRAELIVVR
ncbi:MAG TPA: class I SAM-dependent methyltransferase [Caulobacteraceae bacterium]